jgi:uncharacterized NAD(P)/FAD-binding protein YdhS
VSRFAVIGAGASGALMALHLLRRGAGKVTLVERAARRPGRGAAYSTDRPEHLLNVTAHRMSVYPDDPGHFSRWFEARGGTAEAYAPRMLFGDYLEELLAAASGPEIVAGEAVDVDAGGVTLADGRRIAADASVLALGNLRPAVPRGIDRDALGGAFIGDPWAGDIAAGLGPSDTVLLLGTGLTAVDAALTLDALGYSGRLLAMSRRGLMPRAHAPRETAADGAGADLVPACVPLLRTVRGRARAIGWREAVHALRPVTQGLWAAAPEAERRRFVRHLRPWWDVHRHRVAPAVAATLSRMEEQGRLAAFAGRLIAAEPAQDGVDVRLTRRGADAPETLRVARIVNCTGPEADIARAGDPLLGALLEQGRIVPGSCRLGIAVDPQCRTLARDGTPSERLLAIGPLTRGAFWESVAIPDIAVQAANAAARLLPA